MKRKNPLRTIPSDTSADRAPTPLRPVRSRSRPMEVDTHVVPHRHPWSQFTYCANGLLQVTVVLNDVQTTYIVPPSRAVWIPPQMQHTVVALEDAAMGTVDLAPAVTPANWTDCRVLVVSGLLRELIQTMLGSKPGKREEALMALTLDEIIHADTQDLGVPMPHPDHGDKRLRALCAAVLHAPAERATLAEWAVDIGASERTVARLFRTELGTNYQQWRQQAILAHALPLLARGTPIRLVAAASGYTSDSAFSAMFKSAMGKAPSHFQTKSLSK